MTKPAADNCKIVVRRRGQELEAVIVSLYGDAAHIPSLSNHRKIVYCWRNTKTGKRRVPMLKKTEYQLRAMQRLSDLFSLACLNSGCPLPSFGDHQVYALALLAARKGVWDSHNAVKALGDWMQAVTLINNDSQAEIDVRKKTEYQPHLKDLLETEIIIVRRSFIYAQNLRFIDELKSKVA